MLPENFPVAELEQAGYELVHHSGGQWAGVALLVRRPLAPDQPLLGLPGDAVPTEARWCEATVSGIRFVSTYVPNGRTLDSPEFPRKLEFLEAAAKRAAAIRTENLGLVIAGDMNVAPADADVYDPQAYVGATHVSEPERRALEAIEQEGSWSTRSGTCTPTSSSSPGGITVPATSTRTSGCGSIWRWSAARWPLGLMACGIDRDFRKGFKPSDHAPLLVWMGTRWSRWALGRLESMSDPSELTKPHSDNFRSVLGRLPTGVVVVTGGDPRAAQRPRGRLVHVGLAGAAAGGGLRLDDLDELAGDRGRRFLLRQRPGRRSGGARPQVCRLRRRQVRRRRLVAGAHHRLAAARRRRRLDRLPDLRALRGRRPLAGAGRGAAS